MSDNVLTDFMIFVQGRPAPQGSKTPTGRGNGMRESSKYLKPWREEVRTAFLDEDGEPLIVFRHKTPVYVNLVFDMPRPKYLIGKPTPPFVKKPDIDKLERGVLDALTQAGVWGDDSQANVIHAMKRYAADDHPSGCDIYLRGLV